jgi:hypothetical protein
MLLTGNGDNNDHGDGDGDGDGDGEGDDCNHIQSNQSTNQSTN